MAILAFDIPESHVERVVWLEQQLTGASLARLVAELEAVHYKRAKQPVGRATLNAIIGPQWNVVLSQGLRTLNQDQLSALLTQPRLLLLLQERILADGGQYWDRLIAPQHAASTAAVWTQLSARIPAQPARPMPARQQPAAPPAPAQTHTVPAQTRGSSPLVVASAAIGWVAAAALAVLLAVSIAMPTKPAGPTGVAAAWGWAEPGALPQNVTAKEYLESLAASGAEWKKRRPESREQLRDRLVEFRLGCSHLLLSEHKPLSPEDRQWLDERCRDWIGKVEGNLAAAESDRPWQEVLAETDALVDRLVTTLRERAAA